MKVSSENLFIAWRAAHFSLSCLINLRRASSVANPEEHARGVGKTWEVSRSRWRLSGCYLKICEAQNHLLNKQFQLSNVTFNYFPRSYVSTTVMFPMTRSAELNPNSTWRRKGLKNRTSACCLRETFTSRRRSTTTINRQSFAAAGNVLFAWFDRLRECALHVHYCSED